VHKNASMFTARTNACI